MLRSSEVLKTVRLLNHDINFYKYAKHKPSNLYFRDIFIHYMYSACSKPSCCRKSSSLLCTLKLSKLCRRLDSVRHSQEGTRVFHNNQVISCSFQGFGWNVLIYLPLCTFMFWALNRWGYLDVIRNRYSDELGDSLKQLFR